MTCGASVVRGPETGGLSKTIRGAHDRDAGTRAPAAEPVRTFPVESMQDGRAMGVGDEAFAEKLYAVGLLRAK